jgi:hypothetical protein
MNRVTETFVTFMGLMTEMTKSSEAREARSEAREERMMKMMEKVVAERTVAQPHVPMVSVTSTSQAWNYVADQKEHLNTLFSTGNYKQLATEVFRTFAEMVLHSLEEDDRRVDSLLANKAEKKKWFDKFQEIKYKENQPKRSHSKGKAKATPAEEEKPRKLPPLSDKELRRRCQEPLLFVSPPIPTKKNEHDKASVERQVVALYPRIVVFPLLLFGNKRTRGGGAAGGDRKISRKVVYDQLKGYLECLCQCRTRILRPANTRSTPVEVLCAPVELFVHAFSLTGDKTCLALVRRIKSVMVITSE